MSKLTCIGFDADDTLWENEQYFRLTHEKFIELLKDHADESDLCDRLLEAERRNLGHYGFGVKGFVLSMIETAIEVTDARVPATIISEIMNAGQEMLAQPIDLLPDVEETIHRLSPDYTLVLITKGDLLDQERKLAHSGLGELFDGVEIVSNKDRDVYHRIFNQYGSGPKGAMMVGNSMKSDVRPALEAGSFGTYVPSKIIWELEMAPTPQGHPRYNQIMRLGALPSLLEAIAL